MINFQANCCDWWLRPLFWHCPRMNIDDKSTLVQVMAWCHQATSHYLSQCWPRSLSPYGIPRPQWVNLKWIWMDGESWISWLLVTWWYEEPSHQQAWFWHIFYRILFALYGKVYVISPGQNGRHFTDNTFKGIFMNENFCIWFQFHWSLFLKESH